MPLLQPPLIPLPTSSSPPTSNDTEHDIYSPLFRTPPSSTSIFGPRVPGNPTPTSGKPSSEASPTDAQSEFEFGSFVSVDSSQDPLGYGIQDANQGPAGCNSVDSFGPFGSVTAQEDHPSNGGVFPFNDQFFETAKMRSKENEKRVLGELLNNDGDPLNWLNPTRVTSSVTPQSQLTPLSSASPDLSNSQQLVDVDPDFNTQDHHDSHTASQRQDSTSSHHSITPTSPMSRLLSRKSSLPTLSSSPPAEPIHDPMSMSMYATSPGKAHQLLGTISSSSSPLSHSPLVSHNFNLKPSRTLSSSIFNSFNSLKSTPHHPPFARDIFIAPSGAPGFEGDRMWNDKGFEFDEANEKSHRIFVKLTGRRETTTGVMTPSLAAIIRPSLPALARLSKEWSLLYSLDQHGISLHTFYQRCENHEGGSLLAIQDADGSIFGSWINEPLKEHTGSYYGTGDSFLWKQVVQPNSPDDTNSVKVFKWTGKNDYVALCEPDSVSFGGGDGHYGLYISSSLIEGSSARCPTFDNDVLCTDNGVKGRTVEFDCVGVEVWGVKLGG